MTFRITGITIGLLLLLSGCGAASGPTASPSPPTSTPATIPPAAQPAVQAAIADLSRRQSVDPSRVTVTAVEMVEWPSGALGCPQPGKVYTQVITPGWRLTLQVDGQTVTYHTNHDGSAVVACNRP